jgi:hypothetical protein
VNQCGIDILSLIQLTNGMATERLTRKQKNNKVTFYGVWETSFFIDEFSKWRNSGVASYCMHYVFSVPYTFGTSIVILF